MPDLPTANELVCLRHTDRRATARCSQCMKPLCPECVLERTGYTYCGTACADRHAQFRDRERALAAKRGKAASRMGPALAYAGIAVLVAGILYYVVIHEGVRSVGGLWEMLQRMF